MPIFGCIFDGKEKLCNEGLIKYPGETNQLYVLWM